MDAPANKTTAPESPIQREHSLAELAARRDLQAYVNRWIVHDENASALPLAASFNASI